MGFLMTEKNATLTKTCIIADTLMLNNGMPPRVVGHRLSSLQMLPIYDDHNRKNVN